MAALDEAVRKLIARLGLDAGDDLDSVFVRVSEAARNDISEFRRGPSWPVHSVRLNMRTFDGGSSFQAEGLAAALEVFSEFTIVAAPGTGKTTTLVHLAEAVLHRGELAAIFVPLAEWSAQPDTLFNHLIRRPAYRGMRSEHLMFLASHGRLVLALDGWNELDNAARRRIRIEAQALRRHYPELRFALSTRQHAMDMPVSGDTVEIDELDDAQQLEIARALRGDEGAELLDAAWRTAGVRELIAIPLYLTVLLSLARGRAMPETKEEILRQFVAAHEAIPEHAEALNEGLLGHHRQILTALAVTAMRAATSAVAVSQAHVAFSEAGSALVVARQLSAVPEPVRTLDLLVSHHVLLRAGADMIRFQHHQIQEWYASHDVEELMRASAAGDVAAHTKLCIEVLDACPWEEAILFACERVSRDGSQGAAVVANTVTAALSVDPLLAAAMIRRSATPVWERMAASIRVFVARWHRPGTADRAFRFMLVSGRPEFAKQIWPLIQDPNTQIHLRAMRSASRFHASVLGTDAAARLAALPDATRTHVLSELVMRGDVEALSLVTKVALTETNTDVQLAVVEALSFRRADRHMNCILRQASSALWAGVAARGHYIVVPSEPAVAERFRAERKRFEDTDAGPEQRLGAMIYGREEIAVDISVVADAIADLRFDASSQNGAVLLHRAFETHPRGVSAGLHRRLESGLEMPFHAEEMLTNIAPVDDGTIPEMVLNPDSPRKEGHIAATLAGARTVMRLLDAVFAAAADMRATARPAQREKYERYRLFLDRLTAVRTEPFIEGLVAHQGIVSVDNIGVAASIIASHGGFDERNSNLVLTENTAQALAERLRAWTDILVQSPDSHREHLADLAVAIGRADLAVLIPEIERLLDEELSRWRNARHAVQTDRGRASQALRSQAMTSWTLRYRQAFTLMHGDEATVTLGRYLEDEDFGFDAACAMQARWDRVNRPVKSGYFRGGPDFSVVVVQRAARASGAARISSPEADLIWSAVERLLQSETTEKRQRLALGLSVIGLLLPHGDRPAVVDTLLALPLPIRDKRLLLTALVQDGEIVDATQLLDGVRACLDHTNGNTALLKQNLWEIAAWLELLPYSDRPGSTLEGLAMADAALRHPHELDQLVAAIGQAPCDEAEELLGQIAAMRPGLSKRRDWVTAMMRRDTVSGALRVLDGIVRDAASPPQNSDSWWIARELAALAQRHPALRKTLQQRYAASQPGVIRSILEGALSERADADCVRILLHGYIQWQCPFDGTLQHAIREAALERQPVNQPSGAFHLEPVPLLELRHELVGWLSGASHEAALAAACLREIDELRDEYGAPEFEPRHPNLASGCTWPVEIDG